METLKLHSTVVIRLPRNCTSQPRRTFQMRRTALVLVLVLVLGLLALVLRGLVLALGIGKCQHPGGRTMPPAPPRNKIVQGGVRWRDMA